MPYLSQNIHSFLTRAELGRAGDEVEVIDRRGHVLIVQHSDGRVSPPFSVTQNKISYEPIEIDSERVEEDTRPVRRQRSARPKGNGQADHDKKASLEQISLW